MTLHLKSFFSGHINLKLLDPVIFKFKNRSASRADKVVVMAFGRTVLVPGKSVLKSTLFGQSGVSKQLERAIDRRIADPWMGLLDPAIQFFCADVPPRVDKNVQDRVTLGRRFESLTGKILREMFGGRFPHKLILITIFNYRLLYTMEPRRLSRIFLP